MTTTTEREAQARARPAWIIVADDDEDMRQLVAHSLRREGYDVQEVSNGSELLVRIEDSLVFKRKPDPVDLFITDVQMPGYTGLEIVTGLREAGMHMPVIIMTAFEASETRVRAEALGAAFLPKPFDGEQLCALVRHVLAQKVS
jgi:two-component system response regulator AtoC